MTSKSKIRSPVPTNVASAIRKASIDQIGKSAAAAAASKAPPASTASSVKPSTTSQAVSFDKASLAQSAEKFSAILAKQPIDGMPLSRFIISLIKTLFSLF